jgi:thioredoxin 1
MMNQTLDRPQRTSRGRTPKDNIRTVNSSTFQPLVLEGKGPIVVEFMSYSCSHCGAMELVLQQVAETVKSKEKFFRVNTAMEPELAGNFKIQGTPTLIMFLNGREVGRVEGPSPTISSVLTAVTQPFES